jgi:phospholipid transport system substrate-binding protein
MRVLALLCALLLPIAAAAAQELSPEALVRQVTADVLDSIQNDAALQAGDRKKAIALAEQKVLPHIDFTEATRLALGSWWKTATPAQREKLSAGFRSLLVRTYANAIGAYKGQSMRVLPVRMEAGADDVTVRNQFLRPGAPPLRVDYAMYKTPAGWKIYDIVAEGVSLVLTYRAEFDQVARQSGIDGLIQRIAEKQ